MICRFCNSEMGDDHKFCPYCGKSVEEEIVEIDQTEDMLPVEEREAVFEESCQTEEAVCEDPEGAEDAYDWPAGKPKRKVWPIIAAVAGAVVALGVLAVVLLIAMGVDLKPRANDIHVKDSYSVEDDKAEKTANKVIANINGKELTNAQLQIYFRMQVMDFANYYGDYASQLGVDFSKPLSEQTCTYDEELTWEQYFVDVALETWRNYQTLGLLAEEAGYAMSAEWEESLNQLPADLEEQVSEGEYESVDAMLEEIVGPGCDLETYMQYVRLAYLGSDFYNSEYERLTPNQEEIEAYFAENEEYFAESGITKESGLVSDVRHILICPKGGTEDEETGETTYSDAEWAACYAEAEAILNEWKNGEATEDSFAALVATYTEDTGSATTGGLYEGVAPGSNYVENFLNWAVDMNRQPGDTEIVQTEFGYHIMYFVAGEAYWIDNARTQLLSERTTELIDGAKEKWPMKVNYRKITIAELDL